MVAMAAKAGIQWTLSKSSVTNWKNLRWFSQYSIPVEKKVLSQCGTRLVWLQSVRWTRFGFSCLLSLCYDRDNSSIFDFSSVFHLFLEQGDAFFINQWYFEEIEVNTRVMSKSAYAWPAWHVSGSLHVATRTIPNDSDLFRSGFWFNNWQALNLLSNCYEMITCNFITESKLIKKWSKSFDSNTCQNSRHREISWNFRRIKKYLKNNFSCLLSMK